MTNNNKELKKWKTTDTIWTDDWDFQKQTSTIVTKVVEATEEEIQRMIRLGEIQTATEIEEELTEEEKSRIKSIRDKAMACILIDCNRIIELDGFMCVDELEDILEKNGCEICFDLVNEWTGLRHVKDITVEVLEINTCIMFNVEVACDIDSEDEELVRQHLKIVAIERA